MTPARCRPRRVRGRARCVDALRAWVCAWVCATAAGVAAAQPAAPAAPAPTMAPPAAQDPALEKRVQALAVELRCLVCQNQTIADSNADLAVDLRNQVREMLRQGRSEREIIDFMTARYGDFVLYRPPVRATTALLWFGPAALLVTGVVVLLLVLRRRSRLAADAFEPDTDLDTGDERPAATRAGSGVGTPADAR